MDKQLIERMKAEVRAEMRSMFSPSVESFIDDYTDRLLARIDAERGKEAVAWVAHGNSNGIVWNSARLALDDNQPLFLSPTIPEGMAQDAERYRFIRMNRLWLKANLPLIAAPAFDEAIDAGLLAAAKGEHYAD